jgi:hypothetical protein
MLVPTTGVFAGNVGCESPSLRSAGGSFVAKSVPCLCVVRHRLEAWQEFVNVVSGWKTSSLRTEPDSSFPVPHLTECRMAGALLPGGLLTKGLIGACAAERMEQPADDSLMRRRLRADGSEQGYATDGPSEIWDVLRGPL